LTPITSHRSSQICLPVAKRQRASFLPDFPVKSGRRNADETSAIIWASPWPATVMRGTRPIIHYAEILNGLRVPFKCERPSIHRKH
jgi:hypothetical protein